MTGLRRQDGIDAPYSGLFEAGSEYEATAVEPTLDHQVGVEDDAGQYVIAGRLMDDDGWPMVVQSLNHVAKNRTAPYGFADKEGN